MLGLSADRGSAVTRAVVGGALAAIAACSLLSHCASTLFEPFQSADGRGAEDGKAELAGLADMADNPAGAGGGPAASGTAGEAGE